MSPRIVWSCLFFFLIETLLTSGQVNHVASLTIPTDFQVLGKDGLYYNYSYMAANWKANELYITNRRTLTIIDTMSWSVKSTIQLLLEPSAICVASNGTIATPHQAMWYDIGSFYEGVAIIDPSTGSIRNKDLSGQIEGAGTCGFSADGSTLFVLSPLQGPTGFGAKVLALDSRSLKIVATWMPDGNSYEGIQALPNGKVYLISGGAGGEGRYGDLKIIGAGGEISVVNLGRWPSSIALASNGRAYIWACGNDVIGIGSCRTVVVSTESDQIIDELSFGNYYMSIPGDDPWYMYIGGIVGVNLFQKEVILSKSVITAYRDIQSHRQANGIDSIAFLREGGVDVYETRQPSTVYSSTNAASFSSEPVVSPGQWVALFGWWPLSVDSEAAKSIPLPTQMADVQVMAQLGSSAAVAVPLNYVGKSQINLVFPFDAEVGSQAKVWTVGPSGQTSNTVSVNVVAASPASFGYPDGSPILTDANGNLISAVKRGSTIVMYFNGMGQVTPNVASGSAAPSEPLSWTTSKPQVLLGGIECDAQYYGLVPTLVSLWQLNISVPSNVPTGAQTLVIHQADASSPTYTVTVN